MTAERRPINLNTTMQPSSVNLTTSQPPTASSMTWLLLLLLLLLPRSTYSSLVNTTTDTYRRTAVILYTPAWLPCVAFKPIHQSSAWASYNAQLAYLYHSYGIPHGTTGHHPRFTKSASSLSISSTFFVVLNRIIFFSNFTEFFCACCLVACSRGSCEINKLIKLIN